MMRNGNFLPDICAAYNQLTKAEKKIADYVLENAEQVLYMSITDLADICGVGDTSVYRFCRTMKLQGYQEFKVRLSLSVADGESALRSHSDGEKGLVEQVLEANVRALQETHMLLDMEKLSEVVSILENAEKVYFFGLGDSLQTAKIGANRFFRITGKAYCLEETHQQAMAASLTGKKDVIVIVSYSGTTKDNIQVAKEAKKAGATLIALTHYKKSELTAFADHVLLCGAKESPLDGGSMAAKMGQLFLIDLLYQEYYERNIKECKIMKEKTAKAVMEKLY